MTKKEDTIPKFVEDKLLQIAQKANLPYKDLEEVYLNIVQDTSITPEIALGEMEWFYNKLGLDQFYFQSTPNNIIAKHIESIYASKILAKTSGETVNLELQNEAQDRAMYVCRDEHNVAIAVERRLEEVYPDYRLQSYRSLGTTAPDSPFHLRLYFVAPANFIEPDAPPTETDIYKVAAKEFFSRTKESSIQRYQRIIQKAVKRLGPTIDISPTDRGDELRIMIAYRRGFTHSYFSAVSDVLNYYGFYSNRKFVEQFSNGLVVYSIYLDRPKDEKIIEELKEDLSLVFVLPRSALSPLFREGKLSAQEVMYAYAAWKFVHQFLTRYNEEYVSLSSALKDDPIRLGLLNLMKNRLSKDTFTEGRICDVIFEYPHLIKKLYRDFALRHQPGNHPKKYDDEPDPELLKTISQEVASDIEQLVLNAFITFNRNILKTNFYQKTKTSLAFRLDPSFLSPLEYPDRPYGIFFLVGSEFRAFHVRFRDVARGGIRILRSPDKETFTKNAESLFDENYRLAHTQQKKNKDIPEGGSKGVILLSFEYRDRVKTAFEKYVDGLLDLLLKGDEIVDHFGKEEILFLGPDEGTAELMDWASLYAKERNYPFWKAFTTGKSVEYGGIPHDKYGITTRGVHQYVLGILEKENVKEEEITKFQTGGPDGDLGSNEIKISKDKTIGVVDGSGVLWDPDGIDRKELLRLAELRQPVAHFNPEKIGPKGFLVKIEDRNVTLPDGTKVENGLQFRNNFHLLHYSTADLFVPCGGRPSAVHINNVQSLFDSEGNPRFKYIVEGANLFFTQEARLELEKAGVIIYKDSSANKGGVTASSLEVLAALSLSDEEFQQNAIVKNGDMPKFYQCYIQQVIQKLEENARLEFECIWKEHQRTKKPRSIISDELSEKINKLNDRIQESSLWENEKLRRKVIAEYIPACLLDLLGLDAILERVPENYLRAIFGAHLASRFIYKFGLLYDEVSFFEFIHSYLD